MSEGTRAVVWISHRAARCDACTLELARGEFIAMDRAHGIRCIKCARLDGLAFLPAGDVALTRRALALSARSAVVLKFSRARRRNERQGVLVEETAIEQAEIVNTRDAARRELQRQQRGVRDEVAERKYVADFAAKVVEMFPEAPPREAEAIAARACERYCMRVGRSARAKALADDAIALAVRAHVRHAHTEYDRILAEGMEPAAARGLVRSSIERVLARWRGTAE
jgi:hypothetical protein